MSNEKPVVEVLHEIQEELRKKGSWPWPNELYSRLFDMLYDANSSKLPDIEDRTQLYINDDGRPWWGPNDLQNALVAEIEQFEQA